MDRRGPTLEELITDKQRELGGGIDTPTERPTFYVVVALLSFALGLVIGKLFL